MKHTLFTACSAAARLTAVVLLAGACAGCPANSGTPETPPDRSCEISLAGLAKAIEGYRADNGPLPQTATGPTGFKHSWRMLVAPYRLPQYSGEPDYRLEERWDSPHNLQQPLHWVPCLYTCPLESPFVDYPYTSYLMLVRSNPETTTDNVHDETLLPDDAVLIVESVGCRIKYGEPRDVAMESLFEGDSPFGVGKLNSLHKGVVKAIRVDGQVIDIPTDISKTDLRKVLEGVLPKKPIRGR